jgi:hypothetical protein
MSEPPAQTPSSTVDSGGSSTIPSGTRASAVKNLKVLKTLQEEGTKKDYEDFLEKIYNHVMVTWTFGSDIAFVVKKLKDPTIEEPEDLKQDETSRLKIRVWNVKVDHYTGRIMALEENKMALYALITEALSKIMKGTLRGKKGYENASENANVIWLLESLDEIMVKFEEVKPKLLSIDDQMERIMRLKQGETTTNEDFVKQVMKEVKVFEKHGGLFLWGPAQDEDLVKRVEIQRAKIKKSPNKEI